MVSSGHLALKLNVCFGTFCFYNNAIGFNIFPIITKINQIISSKRLLIRLPGFGKSTGSTGNKEIGERRFKAATIAHSELRRRIFSILIVLEPGLLPSELCDIPFLDSFLP